MIRSKFSQTTRLAMVLMVFSAGSILTRHTDPGLAGAAVQNPSSIYLFGVVNDDGLHYDDLWQRGVRAVTFEFQWKRYEPQEGVYDQDYINHMQQLLTQLNNQGWYVQMIPGFHYTPDWVFASYTGMHYVNQYGDIYDPDPFLAGDFRVINAPFNPQARSLVANYLAKIFTDFDQRIPAYQFDSVRIGGGVQGELRYPPALWNGKYNSFWAFDASAQNPAVSGIPVEVVNWRPGIDANPGTTGRGQLIVNPGFEDIHPPYATPSWSPDDEVNVVVQTSGPHSGGRALKVTLNSPNRVHQYVRVTPNSLYRFGGWLRAASNSKRARIIITQYNALGQLLSGASFAKLETNSITWQEVSGSLQSEPGALFFKVEVDGDQAGVFYFDDLWLKKNGETNSQNRNVEIPSKFYNWYVQKLVEYENWQINEVRKFYNGHLDIVVAGKGVRPNQITDALNNDLKGDGWSEQGSGLYAGSDYAQLLAGISNKALSSVYLTGVEVPTTANDTSPYPGQWSAAKWLAKLARDNGMTIWGENTGQNTKTEMELAIQRMRANRFNGLLWALESELYVTPNSHGYATMQDYQNLIQRFANNFQLFLTFTIAG
jgi:hypothetical protein